MSSPKHSAIHYAQISFLGQNRYTLLHCSLLSLPSVISQTLCHTLRTKILPRSESLHTITLFTHISTKCHLPNTLPYTTHRYPSYVRITTHYYTVHSYLCEVSSRKHSAIHYAQESFLGQNHYTLLHCSLLSLRSVISQTLCHTLRTDILPRSESLHTITLFTLISTKCHLPNTLPYTSHKHPSKVRITTHYYTVHSYLYEVSSAKHSAIHYAQISFLCKNHYTLLHCSLISTKCHLAFFSSISTNCHSQILAIH